MIRILEKIIKDGKILKFSIYNLDLNDNLEFFDPQFLRNRFEKYKRLMENKFEELKRSSTYDINENLKQSALFESILSYYTDIFSNELSLDFEGENSNSLIIEDRPLFLTIKLSDLYYYIKKATIENKDLLLEIEYNVENNKISIKENYIKKDKSNK